MRARDGDDLAVIELGPKQNLAALDLPHLFGREAAVQVDLGCGDGSFLQALAAAQPNVNFLGVERLLRRFRSSTRKAVELPNVRIVRSETMFFLRHVLPAESVDAFYLLFPDPWPKRRHHRRRIVTAEFLESVWNGLTIGGSLFIATDHDDYFAAIRQVAGTAATLVARLGEWKLPPTTFERKFLTTGAAIHRLELRKVSPVI